MSLFPSLNEQMDLIRLGVEEIIPEEELVKKIEKSIKQQTPLKIKSIYSRWLSFNLAAIAPRIRLRVFNGKLEFILKLFNEYFFINLCISINIYSFLFLTSAKAIIGGLLLVSLKMPPRRQGTYSKEEPVLSSNIGIILWAKYALGLAKSNI